MCGIAGYFLFNEPARFDVVKSMCDQIRHRGPDDEGFHVEGPCAIGMRRLSIIDLSSGHQPISNEDGSIWVVFNGELYNYKELRDDLTKHGHRFRTHSDTEVLVHLYEQYGVEGLPKLRGMFGFAIWDSNKRQVLVVRDRFGKKPMYYAALPNGLYFGSELKCLRAAGVPMELEPEALKLYFQFSYIPDPHSPWKAVKKLPPGGWMICDSAGNIRQGLYWKLPPPSTEAPPGLTYEDACDRLRELFDESVRIRLMADVPLGAFLSGGLDSSSVVASMSRQTSDPVRTFSIGFEEAAFNELPHAGMVAKHYKTEHHQILVRPDAVDLMGKIAHYFDEPFGDTSAIPTYLVSEFAVQHVKVALSGDGGDEIFAGYHSFQEVERLRRFDSIPAPVRSIMSGLASALPYGVYGKNRLRLISRQDTLERYFEFYTVPRFMMERILQPEWLLPADRAWLFREFGHNLLPEGTDALLQAFYFEATATLTGDMLVKVDRMSMANSLEVRSPLLDHKLAEFAATLPPEWKMKDGRGKRILVDALGDRLPPKLLTLPKKGFSIPLADWFRGPLREMLHDHLLSPRFLQRGFVSEPFLRYLIEEHESGRRNNHVWLSRLLILELWLRQTEQAEPQPARRETALVQ
jgi:asparagine synthase (glutamine-hydrolysing)